MESCCDPSAHMKGERKGSGEGRGGLGESYIFLHLRRLRDGLRGALVRCKPLVVFVSHADLGVVSPPEFFHRHVVDFRIHCGRRSAQGYDRRCQSLDRVLVRRVHL